MHASIDEGRQRAAWALARKGAIIHGTLAGTAFHFP